MGKNNHKQGIRCRCVSSKHFKITSNDCPVGISYRNAKKPALTMGISLDEIKKAAENASADEEGNCLEEELDDVEKESDDGESAVKVSGMG